MANESFSSFLRRLARLSYRFENPKNIYWVKVRDQVNFELQIGTYHKPLLDKIERQFHIQEGRYEVPVTVPPALLNDCQVSVAFGSIKMDRNWSLIGVIAKMPEIPIVASP